MKKIKVATLALTMGLLMAVTSCGPNDDSGGMDQKNSDGEGEIDSTRIPGFDTTSASLSIPDFNNYSIEHKINELEAAKPSDLIVQAETSVQ